VREVGGWEFVVLGREISTDFLWQYTYRWDGKEIDGLGSRKGENDGPCGYAYSIAGVRRALSRSSA
jgi:hypothetical protein